MSHVAGHAHAGKHNYGFFYGWLSLGDTGGEADTKVGNGAVALAAAAAVAPGWAGRVCTRWWQLSRSAIHPAIHAAAAWWLLLRDMLHRACCSRPPARVCTGEAGTSCCTPFGLS